MEDPADVRNVLFGPGLIPIPERLLLAHARGEVLIIAGAGVSQPGFPSYRNLALQVYQQLDSALHAAVSSIPDGQCRHCWDLPKDLKPPEAAEARRLLSSDYDVALGMLERRMDNPAHGVRRVREVIASVLRNPDVRPAPIHRSLMRLADRGGYTTIVTTNFDLLLEGAAKHVRPKVQTYSLGGIPRPGRKADFAGILHIHGALDPNPARTSDLIVSDQDFGEFYLRRRVVPDFIYDAARLFNLVLIGYSANDPPMRYLLNAVAADGTRFKDLKERFSFVGAETQDPVALEDWKGRGITPIPYNSSDGHQVLHRTLEQWAKFSVFFDTKAEVDAEIRRIVRMGREEALDGDRDLIDHFFRRCDGHERIRLAAVASRSGADMHWLDAIARIALEKHPRSPQ